MVGATITADDFIARIEDLRKQEIALKAELKQVGDDISALERARQILFGAEPHPLSTYPITAQIGTSAESGESRLPPPQPNWKIELRGLKQEPALRRIAELQGGTIRVTEARDIIRGIGISRAKPRNLRSQLHHILQRSLLFEEVETGVYRLRPVPAQPVVRAEEAEEADNDAERNGDIEEDVEE